MGVSCEKLSRKFGSNSSDWRKYEKGINEMPIDTFVKVCIEYGWSLDVIFNMKPDVQSSIEEKKVLQLVRKMEEKQLNYFIGLMEFPDAFWNKMFDNCEESR